MGNMRIRIIKKYHKIFDVFSIVYEV